MNTLQAGCFFLHVLCVFDRLDAPKLKSVLCLSVLERAAHAHTHARRHAHTHTHTGNSVSRVDCTFSVLLSYMSSNLATVKIAFYNNRQTIDLILMLRFGQGGTNVRRCEGKSCARRNAAIILRSQKNIK